MWEVKSFRKHGVTYDVITDGNDRYLCLDGSITDRPYTFAAGQEKVREITEAANEVKITKEQDLFAVRAEGFYFSLAGPTTHPVFFGDLQSAQYVVDKHFPSSKKNIADAQDLLAEALKLIDKAATLLAS